MEKFGVSRGRSLFVGLLEALMQAMGAAKGYLTDHGPQTALTAHALARRRGLDDVECARVFFAAILADVGMIGLVEGAWESPVQVLSPEERAEVRMHPHRSAEAVRCIPHLEGTEHLVRHHHEWWNGGGYPGGIAGERIPLGARVLRLADTVTALAQRRPHRGALEPAAIRGVVRDDAGKEFDPALVELWLELEGEGRLPAFRKGRFRELRRESVEGLVPGDVEASAADLLLRLFSFLIDAKDAYTAGHSRRVARLSAALAGVLELGQDVQVLVERAGHLHDVGKLAVPSRVLRKPEALDEEEFAQVRSHAEDGARIVAASPAMRVFAPACRHHHERWDGNGYPERFSRDRIPVVARILAVCDAFDAMTSARSYRTARSRREALAELRRESGRQFGPAEVRAFLSLPTELLDRIAEPPRRPIDPFALQDLSRSRRGREGRTAATR